MRGLLSFVVSSQLLHLWVSPGAAEKWPPPWRAGAAGSTVRREAIGTPTLLLARQGWQAIVDALQITLDALQIVFDGLQTGQSILKARL
jgi:hypothetical protein